MLQSSSAAANSFFDLTPAFESDVLGLDGKITESSNGFTDFENFEVEEVARGKTRDAMQAANHPGVGITLGTAPRGWAAHYWGGHPSRTLGTTALRVT